MKKVLSAILITILAYSIIFATAVFAVSVVAIQTNSDYTAGKTTETKDFSTTEGSKIQLYVRLVSSGEVGGNPLKTGVQWESSNVQVVSISENGLITAQKPGTATITVTYDGGQDTIKVTVVSGTAQNDLPGGNENPSTGGGSTGGGSSEQPSTGGESGSGSGSESGSGSGESTGGTAVVEEGWADFSKAKFEVKKDGVSSANLYVTGVKSLPESAYDLHLFITESSAKPTIDGKKVNGIEYTEGLSFRFAENDKSTLLISGMEKYVELNKDYYFSIVQSKDISTSPYYELKLVSYGTKMVRPEEPKYTDFFFATFTSYDSDQIVTTLTHDEGNARKMQVKIGKITDTSILKKIQNKDANGFASLLNYSKNASAIYDKVLNCDYDGKYAGYAIEYCSGSADNYNLGHEVIDLSKVEDGAYYYLYVKTDDENGKYYSYEGITLALGKVPNGKQFLHYYGSNDFKWADWGTDGNGVLNGNLTKDPTTPDGKLPQTGVSEGILAMIAATAILTGISFVVYSKNRDLR